MVADAVTYDVKKERRDLYAPKPGVFTRVDVPTMSFFMIDGHGDPNTSADYREAVEALYAVSYELRFWAKRQLGRVHTVGPLEGLWSADDPDVFRTRDKGAWDWTLMIVQPDWITSEMADAALAEVRAKKALPGLRRVRFAPYDEGLSVQTMHIGSYDDEGPTLARLHDEYIPQNVLVMTGRHHEIYLSDPRRVEPARLRTILRQPVAANGSRS